MIDLSVDNDNGRRDGSIVPCSLLLLTRSTGSKETTPWLPCCRARVHVRCPRPVPRPCVYRWPPHQQRPPNTLVTATADSQRHTHIRSRCPCHYHRPSVGETCRPTEAPVQVCKFHMQIPYLRTLIII